MFRNLQNVLNISNGLIKKVGVFLPIVFSSSVSSWPSRTLSDPIANQIQLIEKQRLNINVTLWFFSVIIDRSRVLFCPKRPLTEKNRRVNPAARALVTFMAEKFSNFLYNKRPSLQVNERQTTIAKWHGLQWTDINLISITFSLSLAGFQYRQIEYMFGKTILGLEKQFPWIVFSYVLQICNEPWRATWTLSLIVH